MLTEAREAGVFAWPDGVDCISLPAVRKDGDGQCSSRRLRVDLKTLIELRSAALRAALNHFAPDVLIVDHLPYGALGELRPSLELLKARETRLVLGLRDVLEEPQTVRREWELAGYERAISDLYDAVWIYGDQAVYNPLDEYHLSADVVRKSAFTGYLNPAFTDDEFEPDDADELATQLLRDERVMLCQVGGGQDGLQLAQAFVDAELPRDAVGVVLTGPFMPRELRAALTRRAHTQGGRLHVLGLIAEPTHLLKHADRVITMGGYNSVCEAIALHKHPLVVPRTRPRREQLIRATRLSRLGMVDMLNPDELTPQALSAWMAAPQPSQPAGLPDMAGLERVTAFMDDVLANRWLPARALMRATA